MKTVNSILSNASAFRVLKTTSKNIFQKEDEERLIKFNKYKLNIPWYLKPFSNIIKSIAYSSFNNGLCNGKTVTFRRPTPFICEHKNTIAIRKYSKNNDDKISSLLTIRCLKCNKLKNETGEWIQL